MEKTNSSMKEYFLNEQNQIDQARKILLDKSINLKEELKQKDDQIKRIKSEAIKSETDIQKQLAQRKDSKKTNNMPTTLSSKPIDGFNFTPENEINYLKHEVSNLKKQVNCSSCQTNLK